MTGSKRKHIGVLCSTIDIANQRDIWEGIARVAAENDVHLTAYIATYQSSDNYFYSHLDSCSDTMFSKKGFLDGLILSSGYIAQNTGIEEFNRFVAKIPDGLPTVSVSFEIEGIPSVVAYNKNGMFRAIDHLIKEHNKRHIAFVKGPDGHPEAEERMKGFIEALEANGLHLNESYIFPGDFGREGGRQAVASAYDERKLFVDAFVCCNDQSSVGVLEALKKRDIMVPGDVAVMGFDDDVISSRYVPAIATVGQDFIKLGRVSAEILLDMLSGREVSDVTHVIPELIPRQSCGCLGQDDITEELTEDYESEKSTLYNYVLRQFIELFEQDVPHDQIESWVGALLVNIMQTPFKKDRFISSLDRILVTYYHSYSTEFSSWHKALIALAKGVELHQNGFENACAVLSTLTYATTFVFDIRMNEEKKMEYTLHDERIARRRHTGALLLMFDIKALSDELFKSRSRLLLKTAFIGLFRNPVKLTDRNANRTIETIIGFDGDERFEILSDGKSSPPDFSDYSAIDGFDYDRERRIMLFQPLIVREEEVGVMLMPYDSQLPADTYETLRTNISTALKGVQLVSTIRTLSVTDELTGLYNRRGFFQFAYSRLDHMHRDDTDVPLIVFMDLDGLKMINDNYGHNEGDKAIRIFADILTATMRKEDILGRTGGDEFAALSSVKAEENAAQLEERLREAYREYNARGLHPYKIDMSIGCVALEEATRECFEAAMLSADNVLYEEKDRKRKMGLSR